MTNPTPEQIEAAAEAIYEHEKAAAVHRDLWPTWAELSGKADQLEADVRRERAKFALVAAAGVTPQEPAEGPVSMSIMNGWLVEAVGGHTCGAGADGYGHEPGCGYVPVLNLAELDGYPTQVDEAKLAEVVYIAVEKWADMYPTPQVSAMIAKAVAEWLRGGGQ